MSAHPPSRFEKAFACPHCKAFSQQSWFKVFAVYSDETIPVYDLDKLNEIIANGNGNPEHEEQFKSIELLRDALALGDLALSHSKEPMTAARRAGNLAVSRCFVCKRDSLWIGTNVVYPRTNADVTAPNADLPGDVQTDYEEAGRVLNESPRAACALLRLAIQKLCAELTGRDDDINAMIGELVKRGLHVHIQQALDIVRVIGNEAVHPGVIDLKDDRETAAQLFSLVNLIAEVLITQPKHVEQMYSSLPPGKLAAIEHRDAKAKAGSGGEV